MASPPLSSSRPSQLFEIIALIIDIIGDTNLLKELALVSQSFHQICSKHLFATVELRNADPNYESNRIYDITSSKKGFVKLLTSRPDVVKYIRKLTYSLRVDINNDDHLLSPILSNFLSTISRLNCLTITGSMLDWNTLDSSLTSMFFHLMHLPTINHIDLSYIQNFPLSSLSPSVNLLRLDLFYLMRYEPSGTYDRLEEDDSPEIVVQMMPKIRELHTSGSALLTTKLLHANFTRTVHCRKESPLSPDNR
jgi:hypothetical protein